MHEAWLKLAGSLTMAPTSRLHFKRIAARAMRQVLVEAARRRKADKRGGDAAMVTFDEHVAYPATLGRRTAAARRGARGPGTRQRAPGGDGREPVLRRPRRGRDGASCSKVSEATVLRDWRAAKAWLSSELRGG